MRVLDRGIGRKRWTVSMKRVFGFALLCAGSGMLCILMIPVTSFLRVILLIGCIAAGYVLFCK